MSNVSVGRRWFGHVGHDEDVDALPDIKPVFIEQCITMRLHKPSGSVSVLELATAEAEIGALDDGKTGFRTKAKAALGPGAEVKLGLGVQSPTK